MDDDYSKSFTELGVRYFNKYFIVSILSVILIYFLTLLDLSILSAWSTGFSFSFTTAFAVMIGQIAVIFLFVLISIFLGFSGKIRYILAGVVFILFVFCFVPFLSGFAYFALLYFIFIIILVLLIQGIIYFLLGRKEFGIKHQIFVITGFCLAVFYFILFIVKIVLDISADVALTYLIYTNFDLVYLLFFTNLIICIILPIIFGLVMLFFIYNLSKQKFLLLVAFIMGILAPFTFSVTGIISFLLFYMCYRNVCGSLEIEKVKPVLTVPCPFCDREIPMDSKSCKYCGRVFERNEEFDR
jgi:hypothetical protein